MLRYALAGLALKFLEVVDRQRDAVKCFITRLRDLDLGDLIVRMLLNPCSAFFAKLQAVHHHRGRENLHAVKLHTGAKHCASG